MPKSQCTVYIDEAGDLGENRGTQWFVLTAVIVDNNQEAEIRDKLKAIKGKLNLQTVHFRNIKDFNRRAYIVNKLASSSFTCVYILFDTTQFDKKKMPTDCMAYNYICRYLLERVSWLLRDTNREGEIILSCRGTARDEELVTYIKDKLLPFDGNQIAHVFTNVGCKSASSWDMLQLADVCATSMFYSHETNGYELTTPCFAIKLWPHIYRHEGKYERYGLKYFNDKMKPEKKYFQERKLCEKV